MSAVAVGIDIGGTHLRVGEVSADGRLDVVLRRDTPRTGGDDLVDVLVAQLADLEVGLPVGVGAAGMVVDGVLRYSPNLPYADLDVAGRLRRATGRAVTVVNDATAAAFGEHRAGVARGVDDVLMFTLGTGVGGGVVVGGEPLVGAHGLAAEVGHVEVDAHGRTCACGLVGCLETHAAATAIERLHVRRCAEHDGRPLTASEVALAAREGDVVARQVVEEAARRLGRAAATLVTVLDPGMIVLGGGAGPALAPLMAPVVTDQLHAHVFGARHRRLPDVHPAALGDDAGIVGAALLAAHGAARLRPPSRPDQ